jgi:hypothetical protein
VVRKKEGRVRTVKGGMTEEQQRHYRWWILQRNRGVPLDERTREHWEAEKKKRKDP